MNQLKIRVRETEFKLEMTYLILIGLFLFAWAVIQPVVFSPDEQMRYKVVYYIFQHNRLPHGGDPEVMDASWGISYAFYPMLSYMVSYPFMKIVSLFTENEHALLVAARMAEICYGVGSAYYILKISKKLIRGSYRILFIALTTLMPGCFVLFTYVNCDSLSLFATAMLIYAWLRGLETEWDLKSCVRVGVGVSICLLSYYNGYGIAVATVVVFCLSILFCEEKKLNVKKLILRGLFITAIVALLAGWWFIRSYLLYDGDFLGLNITTVYAEQFAKEEYKPSNRLTFAENPNVNVIDMLFYMDTPHIHNWMLMVYYSFIGSFGYMDIWPDPIFGRSFMVFFFLGLLGFLPQLREVFRVCRVTIRERINVLGQRVVFRYTYKKDRWSRQSVFHIGMLIALIMPNVLNIYNSYVNDYQPQGRYSMAMIIPLMYFMVLGYRKIFDILCRSEKRTAEKVFCYGVSLFMVLFLIYCYVELVYPGCMARWTFYHKRFYSHFVPAPGYAP